MKNRIRAYYEDQRPTHSLSACSPAASSGKELYREAGRRAPSSISIGRQLSDIVERLNGNGPDVPTIARDSDLIELLFEPGGLHSSTEAEHGLTSSALANPEGLRILREFATLLKKAIESGDSENQLSHIRSCIVQAQIATSEIPPAKVPDVVLEKFVGVVDSIQGELAYVSLTSENGEEFEGEYSAAEFQRLGIRENRRFQCVTVQVASGVDVRFQPIPDEPVSAEAEAAIDRALDDLFRGDDLDGDA